MEQNAAISSLYVARHRFNTGMGPAEVMKVIGEILTELVGAEEFGVFVVNQKQRQLQVLAGHGFEAWLPAKSLRLGEGVIGDVAKTGKPFFWEPNTPLGHEARLPLAAIPLKLNGNPFGVIAIFRLFEQKAGFSPVDYQLLALVAEQAPPALLSRLRQGDYQAP